MKSSLNLKEIEKRAFRSTYEDGLWDIYYGLMIILMAGILTRPIEGYGWVNLVFLVAGYAAAFLLFRAGKKYITVPRLGMVTFGEIRKKKNHTMRLILVVFLFLQILLLVGTFVALVNPVAGNWLDRQLAGNNELLLVSLVAALILCVGIPIVAYFSDFSRGYYIAILMALAVFVMLFFERALYPIIIGLLIVLSGLVLLFRFLKRYPLPGGDNEHE